MLDSQPIYPIAGAYVLQLHRDARPDDGHWVGRIEYVARVEGVQFATLETLIAGVVTHARRMRDHPGA